MVLRLLILQASEVKGICLAFTIFHGPGIMECWNDGTMGKREREQMTNLLHSS